jgi:hypothetical protein
MTLAPCVIITLSQADEDMIEFFTQGDAVQDSWDAHAAVAATRDWLEKAVIGLNLCPFAKSVHVKRQIRYAVSDAGDGNTLTGDLEKELDFLHSSPPEKLDTTLLIHPHVLQDFFDYNDFLYTADAIVESLGLGGIIQIASFHPEYQFTDSTPDAIENYTNRSPFPMLHLLREESFDKAVESFPDAASIYEKNMATLRQLGYYGLVDRGIVSPKKK